MREPLIRLRGSEIQIDRLTHPVMRMRKGFTDVIYLQLSYRQFSHHLWL